MKKFFKRIFYLALLVLAVVVLLAIFGKKKTPPPPPVNIDITAKSRSFYMGFTPFPPDYSDKAFTDVYNFVNSNSDIIAHHFDSGVPWVEAYNNQPFPKHITDDWDQRKSKTGKEVVYVAITPLNAGRTDLALELGDNDNQPLPDDWKNYALNDEHVKTAFYNYSERVIEFFHPKYLAIGVESNMLLSADQTKWNQYKELNQYVYSKLKQKHPSLVIFSTIQYEDLRGVSDGGKKTIKLQKPEVTDLMKYSDLLALSTYHFGTVYNPLSDGYFDEALSFGKPVAISEMGATSANDNLLGKYRVHGTPEDQNNFVGFVLKQAASQNFVFVINFCSIDYDKLLAKLPKNVQAFAGAWVHTGLSDQNYSPKPALATWQAYFKLPRK